MHFAGYTIERGGEFLPHFFKTRQQALDTCTQNNLPPECIVQLFRNIPFKYVEPVVTPEVIETT